MAIDISKSDSSVCLTLAKEKCNFGLRLNRPIRLRWTLATHDPQTIGYQWLSGHLELLGAFDCCWLYRQKVRRTDCARIPIRVDGRTISSPLDTHRLHKTSLEAKQPTCTCDSSIYLQPINDLVWHLVQVHIATSFDLAGSERLSLLRLGYPKKTGWA